MGRTREFDVDEALDAAVDVLWQRGYAGTSVRQLCEAMELQPGSFYAAFESKDGCFQRALQRYTETQLPSLSATPASIRRWLYAISSTKAGAMGCLLVNSAIETPLLSQEAGSAVRVRLERLEGFFARCLEGREDARANAELLAATVLSLHVLARSGAAPAKRRRIARHALKLTALDEQDSPSPRSSYTTA